MYLPPCSPNLNPIERLWNFTQFFGQSHKKSNIMTSTEVFLSFISYLSTEYIKYEILKNTLLINCF
ncbi:MAG: hypothetical protein LF885_01325 [Rickettsia endosymbiont of Culicoides impunctatus]|uniref:hypothetical protein n=1 Tax=unclassified Candidatus Tisiphia TaxID=2996318 RepID=UPI001E7FE1B8|nr:MAG: hypothetical protein LF885_01325 [Rickettsia endosymbiont of Culicoides impunctatus]